ncbi:MAG TPA: glutamate-1-semialdehyde 2,1-aminomutase [Acidobacteriota bacterium]|nr:glutamate-1-semialdehyde 2,1-aminomutase [Acidobacteriota bacterium]
MKTTQSDALMTRATKVIPGGVNSPVRAFGAVGGTPRFVASGQACHLTDVDGNTYIDFCMSWGPLILGHAHPDVVAAIGQAAHAGTSYGAPTEAEVLLAEKVCEWVGPVEQVRFVSSGTEATMSAIRLARGYTGRDLLVKFAGCYHGHADYLLVQAGSGLATFGTPSSAGVPKAFADQTLVATYNDLDSVRSLFDQHGDRIAAIIVEPVAANNGLILPADGFLPGLVKIAHDHGALLISDEVITGFRLGRGGAAERFGFTPDLMTFGKVIGGGLPVGAFGGPAKIMEKIAPLGPVYQAGTLSGNPLAMRAGLVTLNVIADENVYNRLEMTASLFEAEIHSRVDLAAQGMGLVRIGSIFWLNLGSARPPRHPGEIARESVERYRKLFHYALARGVYIAPSAYEVGFISTAHDDQSLKTAAAVLTDGIMAAA